MPKRKTVTRHGTLRTLKNVSYENQVTVWLMQDGWQVFRPVLDDGHSTDILISDGPHYFRVQVKTVDAGNEDRFIENRWQDSNVDVVVVFARDSNWGYVMPAFTDYRRKLNAEGHQKFITSKREFLRAFHKV
ncbi:MAG: hypothetical protein KJN90_08565 [Gammaproteobacteria bacterium]|nr:hypothetical protein [Gammaproteobacteria bacterium]